MVMGVIKLQFNKMKLNMIIKNHKMIQYVQKDKEFLRENLIIN